MEPDQKIESIDEAFVYLRSGNAVNVDVHQTVAKLFIANCTNADQVELMLNGLEEGEYQIETFDFLLRPVALRTAPLGKPAEFRERCHRAACWRSPAGRQSHRIPHSEFSTIPITDIIRPAFPASARCEKKSCFSHAVQGPSVKIFSDSHPCIQELASTGLSQDRHIGNWPGSLWRLAFRKETCMSARTLL